MSTAPVTPAGTRPGPSRALLVTGLVVAVVLLVGSVAATFAWAPRGWAGTALERTDGPGRVVDRDWADRMERMHDWMHGDGDAPRWWPDERPVPTPAG